jgi:thioredoxin reductase (NADPH)
MITAEDLRAVALFAAVPYADLERLARVAADLQIPAGEYAVNEGDPRALYVVLEGSAAVTKMVAGVERTVGVRGPGEVFGEVPVVLGTPVLASLRATTACRIVRIDPREIHVLSAAVPEVSEMLGALARDRIEGLQDITNEQPEPLACVLGARWDDRCYKLRAFLEHNLVQFEWVIAGEPSPDRFAADLAAVAERLPAVRIREGPLLIQPDLRELARALSLSTDPQHVDYDVAIVGGGPAGLAASVYGASEGLRTVMIEREAPGGQAATSSRIENYLGFPTGVSGEELAARALQQAKRFGAEIVVTRRVTCIDPASRSIELDGDVIVRAKTIILATGVAWRRLTIESCDRLIGRGVYYGAARSEAPGTQGEDVYLIGAGNSAGQAALYFSTYARRVALVVRGDDLAKSMSYYLIQQLEQRENVDVLLGCEVVSVQGDEHLESIDIRRLNEGERFRRETTGLFAFIGADAETDWMPREVLRDDKGYVLTGPDVRGNAAWPLERPPYLLETNAPGVFACGDVRHGSIKRVASGVGEGSMAIAFVHQYLNETGR